ncbi:hypothetical protein [Endozoicomonas euniceicola]|uniref:Uncharacterized protein n=1 Tax=Endozoicomonas euniceicola TaxID=1234143 RepID=A0ABY6H0Y2_9GAMM|nr:hypothetical protein [Endozoicomonas euniceicola]UYM18725.1 hypothetical protein NX720_12730 [Endozoicomonas euniceicola]
MSDLKNYISQRKKRDPAFALGYDLATVAERRDEETVSHEELIKSLKADGKL